ncbi:hypothetical protein GCK72_004636 [Caenorhabditis remanei]|uniref:F-box domain-containing protein n=1 Tax=Caenorhabditis remanei TaxID=31234 RepID=A0A6A5HBY9_CAERE|nr:hypothetical protein GCK72_004636 [Caenorhabditis remanei]KAF1764687.1 hypothetical protein GCK72_004636 [Caenorhabditis remanei]
MNLFKIPYLAQLNIVKQLEFHELFLLGLCSRRSKLLSQCVNHKFDATVIDVIDGCLQVQNTGLEGNDVVKWASMDNPGDDGWLYDEVTNWERKIEFEYRGAKIDCRISFHPEKEIPIIWCKERFKKKISLATHSALCDISNISPILQVMCSMDRLWEFPDVDEIDNFYGYGTSNDIQELLQFFNRVTIRNSVRLTDWPSFFYDISFPLASVDHLYVENSRELAGRHLEFFDVRSALFCKARGVEDHHIINFIRLWLDGSFEKLESMWIMMGATQLSQESLTEIFGAKHWDPTRRAARFKYPDGLKLLYEDDILDLRNGVDIERPSDGRLATIVFEGEQFRFFVWKESRFPEQLEPVTLRMEVEGREKSVFVLGKTYF